MNLDQSLAPVSVDLGYLRSIADAAKNQATPKECSAHNDRSLVPYVSIEYEKGLSICKADISCLVTAGA